MPQPPDHGLLDLAPPIRAAPADRPAHAVRCQGWSFKLSSSWNHVSGIDAQTAADDVEPITLPKSSHASISRMCFT